MDIVDKIMKSDKDLTSKIVKLWGVVMLNYRQPLGNKALGAMEKLTNKDVVTAIAFLTGLCLPVQGIQELEPKLMELLPELNQE